MNREAASYVFASVLALIVGLIVYRLASSMVEDMSMPTMLLIIGGMLSIAAILIWRDHAHNRDRG